MLTRPQKTKVAPKSGYIYVLTHPSNLRLFKIGVTTQKPEQRLAQHNCQYGEAAGQVVKATGRKWELKEYHPVLDPYYAESCFWGATQYADIPYLSGIEVQEMEWSEVESALEVAKKAGIRPEETIPDYVFANDAWVNLRLKDRGIKLLTHVRSKTGKANFCCSSGHEWRTRPNLVAEQGQGCPECGEGERTPDEIREFCGSGVICLLTHPERSGVIKISIATELKICCDDGNWIVHRYRNVDDPKMAESMIYELLKTAPAVNDEPIAIDLAVAEEAFRQLNNRMVSEIALKEIQRQRMDER